MKSPVPSKWIKIQRSTFTLYHGKVTWDEAATFCRKQGARLAILKNTNVIEILTNSMAKSRPGILKDLFVQQLTSTRIEISN